LPVQKLSIKMFKLYNWFLKTAAQFLRPSTRW